MKNLLVIVTLLTLVQCQKETVDKAATSRKDSSTKIMDSASVVSDPVRVESKEQTFKKLNSQILATLKDKNYAEFAAYIHPKKGISFSMYSYLNPQKDKHFTREDFLDYLNKNTRFTWGEKDGTGNLYVLPIKDYLQEWVVLRDFTEAEFSLNQFKENGNTINNIKKIYPDSQIVENYLPGTEIYSGIDWNSLIFIFDEFEGNYYLVAVANNSWTT